MTAPTSACHTKQPLGCRARRCGPSATTRRRPSPLRTMPAGPNLLRYPSDDPRSGGRPGGDRGPVEPRRREPASPSVSGPRGSRRTGLAPSRRPAEKSMPRVPPASPRLAGFLSGISVSNPQIASPSRSLPTKSTTLNGGSLGSWVDEDRSKLRVVV